MPKIISLVLLVVCVAVRISQAGLVAYWDFNEGNGDTLHDKSGNGNNGIIKGATWINGVAGNALQFDGTNNYVEISNLTNFDFTSTFSYSFWIKIKEFLPGTHNVIDKGEHAYNAAYGLFFQDSMLVGRYNHYVVANSVVFNSQQILDRWVHFVWVVDSENQRLYMNGVMINQNPTTISSITTTPRPLLLAGAIDRAYYFKGAMDEVHVYNHALAETEVKVLFKDGMDTSKLVAYWDFNEGTGDTAHDKSGHGHSLTGIMNLISWVPGVEGSASRTTSARPVYFETSSQDFKFGTGDFSLSCWFAWDKGVAGYLFACDDTTPWSGYKAFIGSDGRLNYLVQNAAGAIFNCSAQDTLSAGAFHYFVFMREKDTLKLFVDGVKKNAVTGSIGDAGIEATMDIGKQWFQPAYCSGIFDEIKIYDTALSASEIAAQWTGRQVGSYASRYVFVNKWTTVSGSYRFQSLTGIATDGNDNVYVSSFWNDSILKFDANGAYIRSWPSSPGSPRGVDVDKKNGWVYVSNEANWVEKFDVNGTLLNTWGTAGSGNGQFNAPMGVAVNQSNGDVYVADQGNQRVQRFNKNGQFLKTWGSSGSGTGQFGGNLCVAVDSSGYVYVRDHANKRIQKFDTNGTYILQWPVNDGRTQGDGICVGPDECVFSVEYYDSVRVVKYSPLGVFVCAWGGFGTADGQFQEPSDVVADRQGNVYTTEWAGNRVQKFSPNNPNHPPVFTSTPVTAASVNQSYLYAATAADPDAGDVVSFSLTTSPSGMTINGATITWTPQKADSGNHSVVVKAQDNRGAYVNQSFTVVVSNTVVPPQLDSALASDNASAVPGIDDDDYVTLFFSAGFESVPEINNMNINSVLLLTNRHTWLDKFGGIGGVVWNSGKTQAQITLSTKVGPPTIEIGDSVSYNGRKVAIGGSFGGSGVLDSRRKNNRAAFFAVQRKGIRQMEFACPDFASTAYSIVIYSLVGALVKKLPVSGNGVGVVWDGTDTYGNLVGRGGYIARLIGPGTLLQRRLLIAK
jgi:hypothetical protein